MAKKALTKPAEKEVASPTVTTTPKRPAKKKGAAPLVLHEVAFITHLDAGILAVPAGDWIADQDSPEMVPIYGVVSSSPPCVDTNYHEVVRAGLAYVGQLSAAQCQQDPSIRREWILARRRT